MDLARELKAFSDAELGELFVRRPELLEPPAATFYDLANRASAPYSLQSCVAQIRGSNREVLEGFAFLDQPSSARDLAGLAEKAPDLDELLAVVDDLRRLALIFRTELVPGDPSRELWTINPSARKFVSMPFGLRQPLVKLLDRYAVNDIRLLLFNLIGEERNSIKAQLMAEVIDELSDPKRLNRLLARTPAESEDLLHQIAGVGGLVEIDTRPYARNAMPEGLRWLFSHALLIPLDARSVVVPREVALNLRGGKPLSEYTLRVPEISAGSDSRVDRAPVTEYSPAMLLDVVSAIGTYFQTNVIRPLKTDGLGVKEVRALAKSLGADEDTIARLVELAGLACLISVDLQSDRIATTAAFDEWMSGEPAERWLLLVRTWCTTGWSLSRYATHRIAPLSPSYFVDENAVWRRGLVMRMLADAPAEATPSLASLTEAVTWTAPGRWIDCGRPADAVHMLLTEASLLGLVRNGSLASFAASSMFDEVPVGSAAEALAAVFPAAIRTFTVQADLTALAPSELDATVRAELSGCADIESRGAASLYRFTESSIRRALDNGRTRDDIVTFLQGHATPSAPQPLLYLVDDVARRHGGVVLGSIASYVRVDDPVVLAELVRHKKVAKLGLRQIAPTVAVSNMTSTKLLPKLREAGFFPVEEDNQGVRLAAPATSRAAVRPSFQFRGRNAAGGMWAAATRGLNAPSGLGSFGPDISQAVTRLRNSRS